MTRFQFGLSAALASVMLGAASAQAQTSGAAAGGDRPISITPGNNSGSMPPGTTAGDTGSTGRTLPGMTTNTPLQRSPETTTNAAPPALTTSNADQKTAAAPVRGANSFTMDEARQRIESGGFSEVTSLQKGGDGVWRGTATRAGAPVSVYCDYQGNVGAS